MPQRVQDNTAVTLSYTLVVDDQVVDTTEGREPLRYTHGQGRLIPGLERNLAGLEAGQSKEFTVPPEDAYGQADPNAVLEVPRTQFPSHITPQAGLVVGGQKPSGEQFQATIRDVTEDHVTLDLNHPLAGKTLVFRVAVMEVAPA